MKVFLKILPALIIGLLFWAGSAFLIVNSIRGGHGPGNAQSTLGKMHQFVKDDVDVGLSIPEPVEFNRHIVKTWELAQENKYYPELVELPYEGSIMALSWLESDWHRLEFYSCGKPPIYVVDESLPDGFGFYIEGKDGVSETGGRDVDDINSWDRSSHHYYSKRIRKSWMMDAIAEGFPIGLIAGLIAFVPRWLFRMLRSKQA